MTKRQILIVTMSLTPFLSCYLFWSRRQPSQAERTSASLASSRAAPPQALAPAKRALPQSPAQASAAPAPRPAAENLAALNEMTSALFKFTQRDRNLNDLLRFLKDRAQDPMVIKDSNPYTGEMLTVRTSHPLPGTRYFHAQYFITDDHAQLLQHMSFEFRPGDGAMEAALQAVKNSFPSLGKPSTRSGNFVAWNLADGYVVWLKQQAWEDLQNDPFNSYSRADVGTIRLAVELNPDREE